MVKSNVAVFKQYSFQPGEKVYIENGPRCGDWLVLACDEKKVTLQCPVSKKTFSWDCFCFHVKNCEREWPIPE